MVRVRILNEDFVRRLPARQQPNGARRERFSLCDAYALTPAGNQILTMRARHSGSTSAKRAEPPRHKIAVQINLRCNGQGKANKPKPGHPNCRRGCGGFGSCLQNCPEKDKPASRLPAGHACNFSAGTSAFKIRVNARARWSRHQARWVGGFNANSYAPKIVGKVALGRKLCQFPCRALRLKPLKPINHLATVEKSINLGRKGANKAQERA